MSMHIYLCCKTTGECVEAVASVGNSVVARIEPNAVGAFLTYHYMIAPGATMCLMEIDDFCGERTYCESLAEMRENLEMCGSYSGYQRPILVWKDSNYHELIGRDSVASKGQSDFEAGPGGGRWQLVPQHFEQLGLLR